MMDELWMHRALQLAALGLGKVLPNPLVGAVVVYNEYIIGEGFHQQYGAPHAEVNAIRAVENHELLKESTLYVNLEPCSHYGKTPPCASFIIEKKIPKVVIGNRDPNEKVNGKGIIMLQEAGIEVIENVLHNDCLHLNRRFVTFHKKKRPHIILKWAQTKNGFIDIFRTENSNAEYWITSESLRVFAHKLRNEEHAILVGYNTFKNDNPQLSNRLYGSNQPQRFVLCDEREPEIMNDSFSFLKGNIHQITSKLYEQNIQSVIVEGGKNTLEKFLEANLWDEAYILTGSVEWNAGVKAPKMLNDYDTIINIDKETICHYTF